MLEEKEETKKEQEEKLTQNQDKPEEKKPEPEIKGFKGYDYDAYDKAGFFSTQFFHWSLRILILATKTQLDRSHLGPCAKKNDSTYYSNDLPNLWHKKYIKVRSHALMLGILRSNALRLFLIFLYQFIAKATEFGIVIVIKQMIDFYERMEDQFKDQTHEEEWEQFERKKFNSFYLCGLFILLQFINIFFMRQGNMELNIFAVKSTFELHAIIFRKIMIVSPSSFTQRATQGEIINFVQIDSSKLLYTAMLCPECIIGPFQIIAYIVLLFVYYKKSFIAGLAVMICLFVLNSYLFAVYMYWETRMYNEKDVRMKISSETFDDIKILKLYNWENEFKRRILACRDVEMDYLYTSYKYSITNISIFWLYPVATQAVTIAVFIAINYKSDLGVMLIGMTIFTKIQDPLVYLPMSLSNIIDLFICMRRVERFIRQPNRIESNIKRGPYDPNGEYAIRINHGNFTWGERQRGKKEGEDIAKLEFDDEGNLIDLGRARIAAERKKALLEGKLVPDSERPSVANPIPEGVEITIPIPEDCDFEVQLRDIDLTIKPGEVVGLIGEVGCGKSSLIQAMLNCLILLNPDKCDGIHINGKVGYVSQCAWIQNATIKDNILFFEEYDEIKYQECLKNSQLLFDLDNFTGRDMTEIGEKGVNLSGGQKVRISLARVLYSNPDIYLFDDPISALDANVGKKVMNNCILGYLKGKTRIVVTHALQYCRYMDRVIYIRGGKIYWDGTPADMEKQDFYEGLKILSKKVKENRKEENVEKEKTENEGEEGMNININLPDMEDSFIEEKSIIMEQKKKKETLQIIRINRDEDREAGTVACSVYMDYVRYNGGKFFMVVIFIIMIIWQGLKLYSDIILTAWSKKDKQQEIARECQKKKSCLLRKNFKYYGVYCATSISSVIFVFLRLFLLLKGQIALLLNLHNDMVIRLIKAPINLFHETIPRGQIFNRLSKDLENLLTTMFIFSDVLVGLFSVIGSIIITVIFDGPINLIFIPIMGVYGVVLTRFYLIGSRQLSRMEAISHSPILNTITETIPGAPTILASQKQSHYFKKFYTNVNDSYIINLYLKGVFNWYTIMFDLISWAFVCYLNIRIIVDYAKNKDVKPAQKGEKPVKYPFRFMSSSVGIIFTYSLTLQKNLGWFFNEWAVFETTMVSMERCVNYTTIIQEKESVLPGDADLIKKDWPQAGKIKFENYMVKYRPTTEIVLKGLNFEINAGEKLGIVGRTGSGKSTICLCVFRLLEPFQGTIYIDGVNICDVGLDLLRQKITIIPQDPCLMEGSLRFNIDPYGKVADEDMKRVLEEIGFNFSFGQEKKEEGEEGKDKEKEKEKEIETKKEEIETVEDKIKVAPGDEAVTGNPLDRLVELGGANLSVGERQLVCIARAILRKTRIIVMDEATANIDMKTEEKIQRALMTSLGGSTIITIAHRIKTIINYDRILVLDNGKISELDSPQNLLKNENSLFYQLWNKSAV